MRKKHIKFNIVILFIFILTISLLTILHLPNTLQADSKIRLNTKIKTIAVFPFEVIAKEDVGFIGKGMGKMLCSRIATDNAIQVKCMDRLPLEYGLDLSSSSILEKIAVITELNGVDFILTGSVTIAGESVSSDAKLIEIIHPEELKYINATGTGMSDIMQHASAISEKVREVIHGKIMPKGESMTSAEVMSNNTEVMSNNTKIMPNNTKIIPSVEVDKPLQKGIIFPSTGSSTGSSVTGSPTDSSTGLSNRGSSILLNKKLDMEIRGIATADIDGDGRLDMAVMDQHTIKFFTFANNKTTSNSSVGSSTTTNINGSNTTTNINNTNNNKITNNLVFINKGQYEGKYYHNNISIDAFDANQNGRSEIFITALGKNNYLKSYILEWNGREFEPLVKDADWYFRVVAFDGKPQLIGQKKGHDEIFSGAIYPLNLSEKSIVKQARVIAGDFQIFGFAPISNLSVPKESNSNTRYVTWYDKSGFLNLGDWQGVREWKSTQSFGSTALFIEQDKGKDNLKERIYINSRVFAGDIDNDGVFEIITANNSDVAKGFLSGYRKFNQGDMQVMRWDNGSMVELWKSNPATGYISDFNVMDIDGDWYPEIIYPVVTDIGAIMNKSHSTIFIEKIAHYQK